MRALFFCLLFSLLATAPASADEAAAWAALRSGGNVIALMRHTDAPGGVGDPEGFKLEDCATQRNLSTKGRAEAALAGFAFRKRDIVPARIESSPWCRCIDTARLMGVGAVRVEETFGNPVVWTDRREELATRARTRIGFWQHSGSGVLLVVTHGALIAALTGYNPASGEIVVVDGALKEIGRIPVPR